MKKIYEISDSNGYHGVGEQIVESINFDPGCGEFTQEFIYTDFLGVEKKIIVTIEGLLSFYEDHRLEYATKLKFIANNKEISNAFAPYYIKDKQRTNDIKNITQNKIDKFTVYEIEENKEINNVLDCY